MNPQRLLLINALLFGALGALWGIDAVLTRRREEHLAYRSAFLSIAGDESITPAHVARFELRLPRIGESWIYARRPEGWRLPGSRNVFALTAELNGFLQAILDSRGTPVGRVARDAERFSLGARVAPEVSFYGADGKEFGRVRIGRSPPGEKADECFLHREGDDVILHMTANALPFLEHPALDRLPPLADGRVVPGALVGGPLERITLSGPGASGAGGGPILESLVVKMLPPAFPQERGPRLEWYGVFAGETERRVADSEAWRYANALQSLAFDALLGAPRSPPPDSGLDAPTLQVQLEYRGEGPTHTLELGTRGARGLYYLRNQTTLQVFTISAEKAASLVPDTAALLAPQPESPPPPAPTPQEIQEALRESGQDG